MKRMILAAVAVAGLAMTARADFGGPGMPNQGSSMPMMSPQEYQVQQNRYGLLPLLRKVVWWKNAEPDQGHPAAGMPSHPTTGYMPGMYGPGMGAPGMYGPGMGAPGMGAPGMYGPGMGAPGMGAPGMYGPGMGAPGMQGPGMGGQPHGTLVFPHHQFNRSPRDFFMWEPGRR